jgi:protein-S-isoprenylcysteine O-methyltransferase Ste14
MIPLGNFFFKHRNALFPLALLLLFVPSGKVFADWRIAALLGGTLVVFGQLIRGVTVGLVYIVRGGREGKVYAKELVTDGMFTHCRNPLYVGNYLGILGALFASNSVIALTVGGTFFLIVYMGITLAEEDFLRGKFGGAYEEYCANVPRFAMKFAGLGGTLKASEFNWSRLLLKEYGTMFVSLAGIPMVLLFTRHYLHHLPWWEDGWDQALLIVTGLLLVAYAIARWLKKSGRVQE